MLTPLEGGELSGFNLRESRARQPHSYIIWRYAK